MPKVMRLALKNLLRYKRRTLLTGLLIAVGVVAVIVFVGLSSAFKGAIVGQITDAVLSHLQVHRKGYLASIDNLPLDRMLPIKAFEKLSEVLSQTEGVAAFSPRIKFGAMLSNYAQTTNVRLNGVDPAREQAVVPLLASRIKNAAHPEVLLKAGEVLLPEVVARGMEIKTGDTVVLVANNKDGSVNGMTFQVVGVVESLMGPGGRDGYLHIADAAALLRMEQREISEVAVRTRDFDDLAAVAERLRAALEPMTNTQGKPMFELHTWDELTPFYNVVRMIDVMTLGIKVILFVSPASEAGRATLRLGDNMWLYIPNVGKPIRITSMQSVVGGVFNNADIMRLDYGVEYDVAALGEDQGQHLLDFKAKSGTEAYDRLKMWVLKEERVPTRIDCYAATGMLIKTLHFADVKDIGDEVIRPAVIETDSPLYKGYQSIMVSANLKHRELPDEVFTLNYLPRVKDLR